MLEISSEVEIAADSHKVWKVLADLKGWSSWNPIILNVAGDLVQAGTVEVTMKGKDGKAGGKYTAKILAAESARKMHWTAHMIAGFLFQNEKIIELTDRNGRTLLTHKETFNGFLVPLFWGKMEKWVPSMLNSMNSALKKKVEGES